MSRNRRNNHYHYAEKFNRGSGLAFAPIVLALLVLMAFGCISTTFSVFLSTDTGRSVVSSGGLRVAAHEPPVREKSTDSELAEEMTEAEYFDEEIVEDIGAEYSYDEITEPETSVPETEAETTAVAKSQHSRNSALRKTTDLAETGDATEKYIYCGIPDHYDNNKTVSQFGFNFWGGTDGGIKYATWIQNIQHDNKTYHVYRVTVNDDNNLVQFKGNDSWYVPAGGYPCTLNGTNNNAIFFWYDNDYSQGQWQRDFQVTSTAEVMVDKNRIKNTDGVSQLSCALTSNQEYNEIKSISYAVTTNPGSAGSVTSGGAFSATATGTYVVTATITYNAKGFTGITKTATPTVTINVVDTYSITYYTGTPALSISGSAPAVGEKTKDVSFTISDNTGSLTRPGYTFNGWTTTDGGKVQSYAAGASYTTNDDLYLYPCWAPIAAQTVTTSNTAFTAKKGMSIYFEVADTTNFSDSSAPKFHFASAVTGYGESDTGTGDTVVTGKKTKDSSGNDRDHLFYANVPEDGYGFFKVTQSDGSKDSGWIPIRSINNNTLTFSGGKYSSFAHSSDKLSGGFGDIYYDNTISNWTIDATHKLYFVIGREDTNSTDHWQDMRVMTKVDNTSNLYYLQSESTWDNYTYVGFAVSTVKKTGAHKPDDTTNGVLETAANVTTFASMYNLSGSTKSFIGVGLNSGTISALDMLWISNSGVGSSTGSHENEYLNREVILKVGQRGSASIGGYKATAVGATGVTSVASTTVTKASATGDTYESSSGAVFCRSTTVTVSNITPANGYSFSGITVQKINSSTSAVIETLSTTTVTANSEYTFVLPGGSDYDLYDIVVKVDFSKTGPTDMYLLGLFNDETEATNAFNAASHSDRIMNYAEKLDVNGSYDPLDVSTYEHTNVYYIDLVLNGNVDYKTDWLASDQYNGFTIFDTDDNVWYGKTDHYDPAESGQGWVFTTTGSGHCGMQTITESISGTYRFVYDPSDHKVYIYYPHVVEYDLNYTGSVSVKEAVAHGALAVDKDSITRTGYTFIHWYDESGTSTLHSFSTPVTADVHVYAKWSANAYTITLDDQSGSGGSGTVSATYDAALASVDVPEYYGYTFGGYYTGTNGSGTLYYNADGTSAVAKWNIDSDTTMYAKWTATQYTITLNLNNGTQNDANFANNTRTYIITDAPITLPTPTRNGYTFGGWYDNSQFTGSSESSIPADGLKTVSYYAKWTPITYTVHLVHVVTDEPSTIEQNESGTKVKDTWYPAISNFEDDDETTFTFTIESSLITLPVENGFTNPAHDTATDRDCGFLGWYRNKSFTIGPVTAITTGTYLDLGVTDITLYAKWTPKNKVEFYNNVTGALLSTQWITDGQNASVTGLTPAAITGYSFTQWERWEDGAASATSTGSSSYTGVTQDRKVYAVYGISKPSFTLSLLTDNEHAVLDPHYDNHDPDGTETYPYWIEYGAVLTGNGSVTTSYGAGTVSYSWSANGGAFTTPVQDASTFTSAPLDTKKTITRGDLASYSLNVKAQYEGANGKTYLSEAAGLDTYFYMVNSPIRSFNFNPVQRIYTIDMMNADLVATINAAVPHDDDVHYKAVVEMFKSSSMSFSEISTLDVLNGMTNSDDDTFTTDSGEGYPSTMSRSYKTELINNIVDHGVASLKFKITRPREGAYVTDSYAQAQITAVVGTNENTGTHPIFFNLGANALPSNSRLMAFYYNGSENTYQTAQRVDPESNLYRFIIPNGVEEIYFAVADTRKEYVIPATLGGFAAVNSANGSAVTYYTAYTAEAVEITDTTQSVSAEISGSAITCTVGKL